MQGLPAADAGLARRASAQLCCLLHTFPGCGIQYEPIPLAWRVRILPPCQPLAGRLELRVSGLKPRLLVALRIHGYSLTAYYHFAMGGLLSFACDRRCVVAARLAQGGAGGRARCSLALRPLPSRVLLLAASDCDCLCYIYIQPMQFAGRCRNSGGRGCLALPGAGPSLGGSPGGRLAPLTVGKKLVRDFGLVEPISRL